MTFSKFLVSAAATLAISIGLADAQNNVAETGNDLDQAANATTPSDSNRTTTNGIMEKRNALSADDAANATVTGTPDTDQEADTMTTERVARYDRN